VRTLPGSGGIVTRADSPAAYGGGLELEGGNVGSHYDFVGGVHAATDACEIVSAYSCYLVLLHSPCVIGFLTCARDNVSKAAD
jgi:hypothetical protein